MIKGIILAVSLVFISGFFLSTPKREYTTMWYVNLDEINSSLFLEKITAYPPDMVLLTVYSADDYFALNDTRINITHIAETLEKNNISYYWGFSLFSRPELFARTSIYAAQRKPVEGYYLPPGLNATVCPLYPEIQDYMIGIINQTLRFRKPAGLSFDHTRFFTFDEGFNPRCREWILSNYGLDIDNFTPTPMFILDQDGGIKWTNEDRIYYDSRAELIYQCTKNITDKFSSYELLGTTMGATEPARSAGQYAELQGLLFDSMLLMTYDLDSKEISRNVAQTSLLSKKQVILGIHPFMNETVIFSNIKAGIDSGAKGIYLLGFNFTDPVLSAVSRKKVR